MKTLKKIAVLLLVAILIAQFFGPEKNEGNPSSVDAFFADTNPPKEVKQILENTCFDCHSNVTKYPWYNSITPVNYWLNHHVEEGKGRLNFSKWEKMSIHRKDLKLEQIIDEVEEKEMPLESYTIAHSEAKLTDDQIDLVISWAQGIRDTYDIEGE